MKRKAEEEAKKSNPILWIGLAAGGFLVLLLLCGGVSIGGYLMWRRTPASHIASRSESPATTLLR